MPNDLSWRARTKGSKERHIHLLQVPGEFSGDVQDEQGEQAYILVVELQEQPVGEDDELTVFQRNGGTRVLVDRHYGHLAEAITHAQLLFLDR